MELNKINKLDANALRKTAQAAARATESAVWEQAVALHRIRYSGYSSGDEHVAPIYELWGYEDWHSYVESEAGIHTGKANRYVQTAHFFTVKHKESWDGRVLSMTKMACLATSSKVTAKNLNTWLSKAVTMTPCEMDHKLHGLVHGRKRSVSFSMTESQSNMINEALEAMLATGEYESRADALVSLVQGRKRLRAAA